MPMRIGPASKASLLGAEDPAPVTVHNEHASSRVLLTCDHAGRAIPTTLGDLGVHKRDRTRHIAWDIGAAEMARCIADILDATLILQPYSRLVIDSNRPIGAHDSIPACSDGTAISGNAGLSRNERDLRVGEIHVPYHRQIESSLNRIAGFGHEPLLIALHTFTPKLEAGGPARPWDLGLLYNKDERLASKMDEVLGQTKHDYKVAHNEPYEVCDESDYTLPIHGENRGIPNLLLEVRNDHVADVDGCRRWGAFLGTAILSLEKP